MKFIYFFIFLFICISGIQTEGTCQDHPPHFTHGHIQSFSVCQNSNPDSINSLLSVIDSDVSQTENWFVAIGASNGTVSASYTTTTTGGILLPTGAYYTPASGYVGVDSFEIKVNDGTYLDSTKVYITVLPLPHAGTIFGASTVCAGSTITLTDTTSGGTWSGSGSILSISSSGVVTGLSSGTDSILYTVSNSCGSTSVRDTIHVLPLANPGIITGTHVICAGTIDTLRDSVSGGTWSSIHTTASVSGGIVFAVSAGTDTIQYAVTNSCGTVIARFSLTINAAPNAGSISGSSTVCMSRHDTLFDAASSGIWSVSNARATIAGGMVTPVSVGVDTIYYTVSNSCGTAVASKVITINPLPFAGSISGVSSLCVGVTDTLRDTVLTGIWSRSNSRVILSAGIITGLSSGIDTISYTVSNSCGNVAAVHIITVNPLPQSGTLTGMSSLCAGTTITLTDTTSGGVWTCSSIKADVVAGLVSGISAGTDTVSYTVTNSCGSSSAIHIITINPAPNAGMIIGTISICPGDTIILKETVTGGTWHNGTNLVASLNIISSDSAKMIAVSTGIDTIKYAYTNSCGSDTTYFPLTVGNSTACPNGIKIVNNTTDFALKIVPNPTYNQFTCNLILNANEEVIYVISNMMGKRIKEFKAISNIPYTLNLDMPSGIYFVTAHTESATWNEKLILIK